MDPTAPLPPAFFDDAFVEAEAAEVLDRAAEADERLRAARALVVGPLLGAASWLVLGGGAYVVIRLLR